MKKNKTTKNMGFMDFMRMPKKLTLFRLFIDMIPYIVGSWLKGEEVDFVIKWDGRGVKKNEKKK